MIITDRDKAVLDFLNKFKIATTSTIAELFYPSLRYAQDRLLKLYKAKFIKRSRNNFTQEYYYYIKQKPKQLRHHLLLTDFYREMHKIADIEIFEKEVYMEGVHPDGVIAYKYKNKGYIACIEIYISHNPLNLKKYEKFYYSNKYKKYFPVFPLIFVITDRKIPQTKLKVIQINENMSNLKEVLIWIKNYY